MRHFARIYSRLFRNFSLRLLLSSAAYLRLLSLSAYLFVCLRPLYVGRYENTQKLLRAASNNRPNIRESYLNLKRARKIFPTIFSIMYITYNFNFYVLPYTIQGVKIYTVNKYILLIPEIATMYKIVLMYTCVKCKFTWFCLYSFVINNI